MSAITSRLAGAESSLTAQRFAQFNRAERSERTFSAELIGATRSARTEGTDAVEFSRQATRATQSAETRPQPVPIPLPSPAPTRETPGAAVESLTPTQPPAITTLSDAVAEAAELREAERLEAGTGPAAPADPDQPDTQVTFGIDDLSALLQGFGSSQGDQAYNPDFDFDGDGLIGLPDLLNVLANFDDASSAVTPPNVFTQSDLDAVKDIFGSKAGEQAFNADYDFDSDGVIGLPDLLNVLAGYQQGSDMERLMNAFGSSAGDSNYLSEFDSNGDGSIGLPDLLAFLSNADNTDN